MNTIFPDKPEQAIIQEFRQVSSWEELVSAGVQARESRDDSQWIIGDLAVMVEKNYGKNSIEKFSTDIGINKNTVIRYRTVSKIWLPSEREKILSHRHHMLLAAREDRHKCLEEAANNLWSVEELRLRLKKEEMGLGDDVKVGSLLLRKDEWELMLKWFAMCLDNPEAMKQITKNDNDLVEKIKAKVEKLREMEKFD